MTVPLFDANKAYSTFSNGMKGGDWYKMPMSGPNPSSFKDAVDPKAATATMRPDSVGTSAFTGKTFNQRK